VIATARPLVDPNANIGTFHYPNIPALNKFYGREAHFDSSRARVEQEGLGIVIPVAETDLRLRGIAPARLATEIFRLAGITATRSSAGNVALRVIQHMGGLDRCRVFKIKGVRDLLRAFSRSKAFSHTQALARIGPGFDAHKGLFIEPRDHFDLLPQDVFLYLVKKNVIRAGVELECAHCQLSAWYSLDDLAATVACTDCGAHFDSGPQLRDDCWRYRVSGVFARTPDSEGAIPVTLALQQAWRYLHMLGMTWTTGMNLTWTEHGNACNAETDLVVMTHGVDQAPEFLIGECKTSMEVNAEQVDKLQSAAARFTDTGIKVYIMFAKAATAFTERELELIDARQTPEGNLILLTPTELEPSTPYGDISAGVIRDRSPLTLAQWAHVSQERYLKTAMQEVVQRWINKHEGPGVGSQ
jgi:hypothetical protein